VTITKTLIQEEEAGGIRSRSGTVYEILVDGASMTRCIDEQKKEGDDVKRVNYENFNDHLRKKTVKTRKVKRKLSLQNGIRRRSVKRFPLIWGE